MKRSHVMVGLVVGIACFSTAIWMGVELRGMMPPTTERLSLLSVDELARAMPSIHRTNQAVIWHYVLMTGFTIGGVLVSGSALIAWWASRNAARIPGTFDPRGHRGITRFRQPKPSSVQIGGKRYLIR